MKVFSTIKKLRDVLKHVPSTVKKVKKVMKVMKRKKGRGLRLAGEGCCRKKRVKKKMMRAKQMKTF